MKKLCFIMASAAFVACGSGPKQEGVPSVSYGPVVHLRALTRLNIWVHHIAEFIATIRH